ncbi:MAG TPA: CHAT domain-containing protein [Candidatus Polarisedimenticolia bacterium]|jgi:CHAT domain-containing protein
MSKLPAILLSSLLAAGGLFVASDPSDTPLPSFADCDARVRREPRILASYWCYCAVALRTGQWDPAVRRLEALLSIDPDNPRPRLYLAWVEGRRGGARAEALYRAAVDGFERERDPAGEVRTRVSLAFLLRQQGRYVEARPELERAEQVAQSTGQEFALALTQLHRGGLAIEEGDYGIAWSLFKRWESKLLPDGPMELQDLLLNGLGNVCWATGRHRDAMRYHRRHAEQMHKAGNLYGEATARFNLILNGSPLLSNGEMTRDELRGLQREALDSALRSGNRLTEASVRLSLAQSAWLDPNARIEQIEKALAISRELGYFDNTCFGLRLLGLERFRADPHQRDASLRLVDEATGMARKSGSLHHIARALIVKNLIHWESGAREEALAETPGVIDAIERIRDLQRDDMVRARAFSEWELSYYRIPAYILGTANGTSSAEEMNLAFSLQERFRSRTLLDRLDAAGATQGIGVEGPWFRQRAELLTRIAGVQRRLLDPSLANEQRSRALEELDRLEDQEGALRADIARSDPSFAALRDPVIPSLNELQAGLEDDQVMLSFHTFPHTTEKTASDPAHWSWVFVITRSSIRALPLPGYDEIEPAVQAFLGLLERRDGSEARGAATLYRDLLKKALDDLPAGIGRLIIIPDGALHWLPFGALRTDPEAPPLATRYEMSVVPSATLWLRFRTMTPSGARIPALALADPVLGFSPGAAGMHRSVMLAEGPRLGQLPFARVEARSLVRNLGGGSRLMIGTDASELLIKRGDLRDFRILYFAAHAVIDDERPERSAVLLAPGSPDEDGLLQMREIVDLDLAGRVVILAACRSASGALMEGEGVMGLARAFFQAGARAVIGGLWPLRDDEAATLINGLSHHLGEGLSLQAALTLAQRERIGSGATAAAWAGLVVLGDGDLVPLPGGRRQIAPLTAGAIVLCAAIVAIASLLFHLRERRSRS